MATAEIAHALRFHMLATSSRKVVCINLIPMAWKWILAGSRHTSSNLGTTLASFINDVNVEELGSRQTVIITSKQVHMTAVEDAMTAVEDTYTLPEWEGRRTEHSAWVAFWFIQHGALSTGCFCTDANALILSDCVMPVVCNRVCDTRVDTSSHECALKNPCI